MLGARFNGTHNSPNDARTRPMIPEAEYHSTEKKGSCCIDHTETQSHKTQYKHWLEKKITERRKALASETLVEMAILMGPGYM